MNDNNHGGKRINSGAPENEGAKHKVPLSLEEKDDLKNLYPEIKTVPKRVKEAIEDVVRYKTEVKDIKSVAMEIFNSEEGRIQFYVYDGGEGGDENKIIDVNKFIECKKIQYYKHSGRFEIDVLMGTYVVGNTKEAYEIRDVREKLETLKRDTAQTDLEIFTIPGILEEMGKMRLTYADNVFDMSLKFGEKYNNKVIEFNQMLFNFELYIRKIKDDCLLKDWLDKNFDTFFKERLRERVSQDQQDSYIKYGELLEIIKEEIAMKNIKYRIPKFFAKIRGNDIKRLELKIEDGTKKLKILEDRQIELDGSTNLNLNIDYLRESIIKEIMDITNKIDEFNQEKEGFKKRDEEDAKLEALGVKKYLVKFKWKDFLSQNEIDFIARMGEELNEKNDIFNTLKRITKKLETEINISSSTKAEIPSCILDKYMSLSLDYLEKLYTLKNEVFDRESSFKSLNEVFSEGSYRIREPHFKEYDEKLGITLNFYTRYPDVSIEEIVEVERSYYQLEEYCKREIVSIIDSFNEGLNKKKEDKEFCTNLIISIKAKIFNYHRKKSLLSERDLFCEYNFKSPYHLAREEEESSQHIKRLKLYINKIAKINKNIFKEYEKIKNERDEQVNLLLEEVKEALDSFDELRDELATIEIKPNNYIISN